MYITEENKNKKVVVFGGAGFLGSHVADALTDRGYEVLIFDLKKSPYLKEGQISVVGDITDPQAVQDAIKGSQIVYNFAALADVEEISKPLEVVRTNILGNGVILEACRLNQVKRFVFASTLYVYSRKGSFYRSSKQACESLIEDYYDAYGLDYTILRYGSLYGPRANPENGLFRMLNQALGEGRITRQGNGEEIREYIHVYDAARLSCDVLADEYKNQAVVITGNQPVKMKDMLFMIKEILNNKVELEFSPLTDSIHYNITPYNFTPKLAKRIQSAHYVDLGQGILDLIGQMYQEIFVSSKKISKIKTVIFDFDGVILESADIKTKAFASLFSSCPAEQVQAILALHRNHGGISRFEKFRMIYQDILKQPLTLEMEKCLGEQFSRYVYQEVLNAPFVEGAREFLEKYHQKMPFFIASGTPDEEIKSLVKDKGLKFYFKEVFGSPAKKSEIIIKIMKDHNFQPQEVVFVGDSSDDEEGAREAGVRFVWRTTEENNPFKELEKIIYE